MQNTKTLLSEGRKREQTVSSYLNVFDGKLLLITLRQIIIISSSTSAREHLFNGLMLKGFFSIMVFSFVYVLYILYVCFSLFKTTLILLFD